MYGEPLSSAERKHVRRWLVRHRAAGLSPTPLLEARLASRYRASRIAQVTAGIVLIGLVGWASRNLGTRDWAAASRGEQAGPDPVASLLVLLVAGAVLYLGMLAALRHQRRADRRIGDALRHRVARPAVVGVRRLVGAWFLGCALVTYGGGLAVGAGAALLASDPADRAVAVAFLAAVLLFATISGTVLAEVSRRPAIAEDEPSLTADEVLRREDAGRGLASPYLAVLALSAIPHSRSGDALMLLYLGYAMVTVVLWAVALRRSGAAPAPVREAVA